MLFCVHQEPSVRKSSNKSCRGDETYVTPNIRFSYVLGISISLIKSELEAVTERMRRNCGSMCAFTNLF
jgi:hypothetical protein